MANLGTERLKIVNDQPEVTKLWNGRYRLEFFLSNDGKKEDWYSDNIGNILPAFGTAQADAFGIGNWEPRTGEAYTDMRCISASTEYFPQADTHYVKLVYETLSGSFVQEKDDDTDYNLNGLKRVSSTLIAQSGTSYSKTVGVTTSGGLLLASYKIEDTDAYRRVNEVWMEQGTLSQTEDLVGSQKSIVIETIGADPSTPTGYSLANKQEGEYQGLQTNRFTFLKDNVELSRIEDLVGSQKSIVIEQFNGTPITPSGYSLAGEQVSEVDGIPTRRYTFLKPSVLSQTEDMVGSQLAIVVEAFNETPLTPLGYKLANTQESDIEGIPTRRYTFLKSNATLSQSDDLVGSQKAIVIEQFDGTPATPSDYTLASTQVSDVDGIPTKRYTFLKSNVTLSKSEDLVGSQLATVIEQFDGVPSTPSGYSIANKQESEYEGIKTNRYTFLKNDVQLSSSEDNVGSQLAITEEWFKPETTRESKTDYSLARKEASDVSGIPTERYTFLKDNVELSRSEDYVGSQLSITIEVFNPGETPPGIEGYSLSRSQVSDVDGIPTKSFTFLKDNVTLSVSQDRVGSQLAVVNEVFNPSVDDITGVDIDGTSLVGYSEASRQKSDFGGIPTIRYTFLKNNVELSRSEDNVGSQLSIVTEVFNPTTDPVEGGYSIARIEVSDVEGIPTERFTFLKDNVELSRSEDFVGSQKAIVIEQFNGTPEAPSDYVLASTQVSDVEGIPTRRYTFLKSNVTLSQSEDYVGSQKAIIIEQFNGVPTTPPGYSVASKQESEYEGIRTNRYTFLKDDVKLSESSDKVGSQLAISEQWFKPADDKTVSGYSLASKNTSDFEGIKTVEFRFLKDGVELSRSEDKVGSQLAITTEVFNPTIDPIEVDYSVARTEVSDVDGIPTKRFTFLRDNAKLSESEDRVGSQLAIMQEWFNPTSEPTISGYVIASVQKSDTEGIETDRYTFLKDNVELSRSEDFVNSQKALVIEQFNGTPATPTGYALASTQVSDVGGIPTRRYTFLKSNVILSSSLEEKSGGIGVSGNIRIETIEVFNPTGTPTSSIGGVLISTVESDVGGIATKRYTFAQGNGEVSRTTETRNNGALTIITIESLGAIPTLAGAVEIEATTTERDGYVLHRYVFAQGNGEVSNSVETRNNGALTITTIESLGVAPILGGAVEIEATTTERDGYVLHRYVFANGNGEVSRTVETRNNGALTITTVESLGTVPALAGAVEIESTITERDGYTLYRYVFAQGNGEVSRTVETRNNGRLTITTVESLGEAGTANGVEIEATTTERDGYTLHRKVFADGNGEVSNSVETRNNGALTITTIESLGTVPVLAGAVEIEFTTTERDGYTLYRKVFADGNGELSNTVEIRNNGALTITTIESLGVVPAPPDGVEIESTITERDGYTFYRKVFAKGDGQISITERPAPAPFSGCTYKTIRSIGTAINPEGVIVESSDTESNGYVTYERTAITGTITGVKETYADVAEVRVPGTVTCTTVNRSAGSISGTIAVAEVTPPKTKKVAATVTVEITTAPPSTASLAYDLGDISCSVTYTSLSEHFRGSDVFVTASGNTRASYPRKTADMSARVTTYPECYITTASASGTFSYNSSYENTSTSPNTILANALTSTTTTNVVATGSTSDTSITTGVLKRNSRPILTALNGTTYYEVVTWSV